MKNLLITLIFCIAVLHSYAQKVEFSAGVYTGLMHFAGSGSAANTPVNITGPNSAYSNNPYGSKTGTGFGGTLQAQLILSKRFIAGLQGGYEALKSEADITNGNALTPGGTVSINVNGSSTLKATYVIFNPYIGYRLPSPVVTIDVLAGFDFAHIISLKESGSAKQDNGNIYYLDTDRKNPDHATDTRIRFGLVGRYHRFGVTANYAHGLKNYLEGVVGGPALNAHTEVIKLGISYQIF